MSCDYIWACPQEIKDSLARYVERGTPTGGFLRAVLENDLKGAVGRADDMNVRCIQGIVRYIYEQLPFGSWGSPERVQAWIGHRGKAGLPNCCPMCHAYIADDAEEAPEMVDEGPEVEGHAEDCATKWWRPAEVAS